MLIRGSPLRAVTTSAHKTQDSPAVLECFAKLHLPTPNKSRLNGKIQTSRTFIKSQKPGFVKLHAISISEIKEKYPFIIEKSEEVVSVGTIIPSSIYSKCPSYIAKLADQINASYESNIFDGCLVLMRRLFEVLLIKSYCELGIDASIRDRNGNFHTLERIVADAKSNMKLSLSRTGRANLDTFRNLGNFSAHQIEFIARKGDIDRISLEYRAIIEELLHKAKLI